jgi:hypothetical protein
LAEISAETEKLQFLNRLGELKALAAQQLRLAQERYKRNYDAHVRPKNLQISPGGWVYVRRELHEAGVNPKLLDQVDGPYEVVSNHDHTLLLQKGPHLVRVNSDRITPAPQIPNADRGPQLDVPDEDATGLPPTDPMLGSSKEGHVVDRIVGLRKEQDGIPRYRVRWYGYGREDDTWEPWEHLPEPLVRSYDRRVGLERSL